MTVLLTRPETESNRLAVELRAKGIECLIDPMLHIVSAPNSETAFAAITPQTYAGLIITSAHAIPTSGLPAALLALPCYMVGERTEHAAQEAGLLHIAGVYDRADALIQALRDCQIKGSFLYLRGKNVQVDVRAILYASGFGVDEIITYEAVAAGKLRADTLYALQTRSCEGVVLFSSRTATLFLELLQKNDCLHLCESMHVYCMSAAIANLARRITWRDVWISDEPNEASMVSLLLAHATSTVYALPQ